jgi:hypothetical protein
MHGTQKQLADHLGVHKSSVNRAVKAGRIAPEADGSFDFAKCTAAWHASSGARADVAARHAASRGRELPQAQPAPKTAQAPDLSQPLAGTDGGDSRRSAKTALMHFENSQIKLEMALRRGLRLEQGAVKREANGLGALMRAGLERVIDQTAPRLAASTQDLERRRLIAAEARRLAWIIKREFPRALRRMKEQGRGVDGGWTARA